MAGTHSSEFKHHMQHILSEPGAPSSWILQCVHLGGLEQVLKLFKSKLSDL